MLANKQPKIGRSNFLVEQIVRLKYYEMKYFKEIIIKYSDMCTLKTT